MNKLIAVYGTLKKGRGNHRIMGNAQFLGESVTEPRFTMYSTGGFPIVQPKGETPIKIEVFNVTDKTDLNRIYGLEGYSGVRNSPNNWYDTVDVETPFGVAEMFVMDKAQKLPIIQTGEW